jgi:hypothetical protein
MAVKDILGSISPVYGLIANKGLFSRGNLSPIYGAATGEGIFGELLNPSKAEKRANKEDEDERKKASARMRKRATAVKSSGMAKGGKVSSASKRGDGCATKGKTKGKFV